jgi:hypothetical protein
MITNHILCAQSTPTPWPHPPEVRDDVSCACDHALDGHQAVNVDGVQVTDGPHVVQVEDAHLLVWVCVGGGVGGCEGRCDVASGKQVGRQKGEVRGRRVR